MNVDKLKQLQAIIAKQPRAENWLAPAGFNMSTFVHHCGTPSCIAGFAATMHGVEPSTVSSGCLRDWFELSRDNARTLCATAPAENYPRSRKFWEDVTPAEAVQAIQNVIDGKEGQAIWAHIALSE